MGSAVAFYNQRDWNAASVAATEFMEEFPRSRRLKDAQTLLASAERFKKIPPK
jgi:TolA-binding protein